MNNLRRALFLFCALAGAGCAAGDAGGTAVQVSVAVPASAAPFAADECGNTLTSAQLVFRRLKLDGDGGLDADLGPFLVDLSGADFDGVFQHAVLSASLPAGGYDRARFEMHALDDGEAGADPVLQELAAGDLSLRVSGTSAQGGAFTVESDVNDEQEIAIALSVGDTVTGVEGITLTVDPATWLGGDGTCLDPVTDLDAIEDRVRASIDLEEDDDEDGIADESGS